METIPQQPAWRVAAFYRFARIDDPAMLRSAIADKCATLELCGTVLVAPEGINGTVGGPPGAPERLTAFLQAQPGLERIEAKYSVANTRPFHRMKVRLKREIVTMGVENLDPVGNAGTYVEAADWNALISDPETIVVDTRNDYEVALGTFRDAVDPRTASFAEFPAWAEANREVLAGRKVAMFCTGGIRCEKATAFVRGLGIDDVFHLRGGILKYLEEVPAEASLWQGECFVFDERVGLVHGMARGRAELCRACRRPLTESDRLSPHHRDGISCVHCHDERSEADRDRYAERQRQVELAAARGRRPHVGR